MNSPEQNKDGNGSDFFSKIEKGESLTKASSGGHTAIWGGGVGVILFCLLSSYSLVTDDSIQIFLCPTVREMDAPVAIRKISSATAYEAENYIRGFVRQYVRALYPKNSMEAKEHFKFVYEHSIGKARYDYGGFLKDFEKIGKELDNGRVTDFFPAKPTADADSMRISKKSDNKWVVEIDGFLNDKKSLVEDDRGIITLRLNVFKEYARLGGSRSGLYVESFEITTMSDAVSDVKKEVK